MFNKEWSKSSWQNKGVADVRIAILTAPIFGGMIGSEKLTYDLWGDGTFHVNRFGYLTIPGLLEVHKLIDECPKNQVVVSAAVAQNIRQQYTIAESGELFLLAEKNRTRSQTDISTILHLDYFH